MKKIIEILKTIFFFKMENKMEKSKEKAPYIGVLDLNGTVEMTSLYEDIAEQAGLSVAKVRQILTSYGEVACENLGLGYKVITPFGYLIPHITKSFPTRDAPFDPATNELIGVFYPNEETRKWVSDIVPKERKDARADLGGPRILSVYTEDLGYSKVEKNKLFRIAGTGLFIVNPETDKVTLTNAKTGAVTQITTLTPSGNGLRIDGKFTTDLPAGAYTLTVETTGGVESGKAIPASRNVEVK